jgi:hypothetical protein
VIAHQVCFGQVEQRSAGEHPHDLLGQMREPPLQYLIFVSIVHQN